MRNLLKYFYLVLVLAGVNSYIFAQKSKPLNDATYDDRPLHFGFTLGINTTNYTVTSNQFSTDSLIYADLVDMQPGFHVSAIASVKIFEQLRFRVLPGFSFSNRVLNYYLMDFTSSTPNTRQDFGIIEKESAYIEVPVLLKYKALRINNYAPYIVGGVNFKYDLMAKKAKGFDTNQDYFVKGKSFDIAYEAGLGIDFYLPYFKFSTEFKISMGMLDIIDHNVPQNNIATTSIDQLKSSMFMISFHFE